MNLTFELPNKGMMVICEIKVLSNISPINKTEET